MTTSADRIDTSPAQKEKDFVRYMPSQNELELMLGKLSKDPHGLSEKEHKLLNMIAEEVGRHTKLYNGKHAWEGLPLLIMRHILEGSINIQARVADERRHAKKPS